MEDCRKEMRFLEACRGKFCADGGMNNDEFVQELKERYPNERCNIVTLKTRKSYERFIKNKLGEDKVIVEYINQQKCRLEQIIKKREEARRTEIFRRLEWENIREIKACIIDALGRIIRNNKESKYWIADLKQITERRMEDNQRLRKDELEHNEVIKMYELNYILRILEVVDEVPNFSYNLEHNDREEKEEDECCVCHDAKNEVTVIPCNHKVMCRACAGEVFGKMGACPYCRAIIEGLTIKEEVTNEDSTRE